MIEDARNDIWGMLVMKHRRMSSNDTMGTDMQLHEGNIHEMTWLGRTGKEAMVAELSFRCMVSHRCFCNRLTCKRLQTRAVADLLPICMVGHIQVENWQKIATSLRSAPRNDMWKTGL